MSVSRTVKSSGTKSTAQTPKNDGSIKSKEFEVSSRSKSEDTVVKGIEEMFSPFRQIIDQKESGIYVGIDISVDYCSVAAYNSILKNTFILVNKHGAQLSPT